jgi:hypothetical protein
MPPEDKDLFTTPAAEVTQDNLRTDEGGILLYDDEAALKLILDDTARGDNFMVTNKAAAGWDQADEIYQSPQASFDGMDGATVPKFTLSTAISAIVPKLMNGIFYENPPFLLRPSPSVTQDIVRAKTALFSYQLKDMAFEEEVERGLEQMALLGTGVWKWGWHISKHITKKYVRKAQPEKVTDGMGQVKTIHTQASDDFTIEYVTKEVQRPWFRYVDRRTVLVDPGCRYGNIQRAKWVVYRDYATYDDLEQLRDVPGYTIPPTEVLQKFFMRDKTQPGGDNQAMTVPEGLRGYLQHALPRSAKSSADPLQDSLEILERWDKGKVIVALRFGTDNILLRNEANNYTKAPFYSANWRNIPDAFDGQGLGLLIGSEQLVEQGITNLALQLLAYGLQPTAVRKKGFNTPMQPIKWGTGKIIDVDDDVDKSFKFMQMPGIPGEAWTFLQATRAASQETSGANEQVTLGAGGVGAHSTGMRSGTGAAGVISANATRLDGPDGRFIRQVFVPWIYQMDELNNDFLPTSLLRDVLGEAMGQDIEIDHEKFRNAKIEYEVLAGSHLGPKKEMAQFLPFAIQLINNPTFAEMIHNAGYMFDAIAVFKAFSDAAGWKYSQPFIRPMTDPEKAEAQANSPARIQQMKLNAAQQAAKAKFEAEEKLQNEKQLGKAGSEVARSVIEHSMASEALSGVPGDVGFGSETAL